jgi:hypothetical protein
MVKDRNFQSKCRKREQDYDKAELVFMLSERPCPQNDVSRLEQRVLMIYNDGWGVKQSIAQCKGKTCQSNKDTGAFGLRPIVVWNRWC